ncbi:carbon catabolite repressor protein 4 homolog 3 isoform X2 [Sorghum bicolor]|uniref:carbon catabolite repressor protein 4 homolog 3 isoform X2 n=1 Tax=Sorghum bicolor TaxID=4558 RepID=UPI000B423916|nr:carbon catabolite repressor protein 4 homolog 3 isoform X2 [Sorghum bicolor]|eukprot:XP_021305271.1 carbon catabolite repressor protein 4 homolog 3 isoform X2 [Sorghum bicolor]
MSRRGAMSSTAAPRARLSPPAPASHPPPRKRGRSPSSAPGSTASSWRASAENAVPLDHHRRRWHNPERAPGRVWQRFRAPQLALPSSRLWVCSEDASTSPSGDACTIMSYNILADYNAQNHPDLYLDVPWDALRWDSRRRLIIREIRHWDPDLVCLQEVDRFQDIATGMKSRGYEGIYQRRTGDTRDGCAMFWKSKRLHLLEEDSIDFSEFNLRNNVAQICVFELNGTHKFVLGNIHVLFNPKRGDIKLGQIRMLLEKANALAEKWDKIPIVLAGDFNSTPDSAIYKFLSTMKLNISLHDRRQLSGLDSSDFGLYELCSLLKYQWTDEEVRNATGCSNVVVAEHPLKLSSSYAMLKTIGVFMVNPRRLPTTRSFLELLIICGTLVELNAPEFWTRYL